MGKSLSICVLGGTGFVGSALVTRLAEAGHFILVPTRNLSRGKHLTVLPTLKLELANVHDVRVLGQLFTGMDVVINLVGILNERGRQTFRLAHVELASKIVEAMRAARVSRLLHMSSLGAGAQAPSQYLRSKGEAEALIRVAATSLDATIFRPSVIFGPRDSLTNRFAKLLRLTRGVLPLARPGARFAPVYVYDVAEAFMRALDNPQTIGKSYELCGPDIMTLADIVRTTAAAANLPCHLIPLPDFLAAAQGVLMDFLPGKPFSYDNYKSLTIDSVCTSDGCRSLGIEPARMRAIIPAYLREQSLQPRLDDYRRSIPD
ncbi:MAG TPA: complex I NDUFA9 subunit family protein [Steroidobacteraceae bacterium]|nr:complex I NDUFA9 subunit family protein [Steroidobacteraceae bacterium]